MLELADDVVFRDHEVLGLRPDALLTRRMHSGTARAGGGAYERVFLILWVFGPDGLQIRGEYFDADREAEALARFDELTTASRAVRVENAATRVEDRGLDAWRAGDWERFAALLPPGSRLIERRRMILLEYDRARFLETFRPMFEMTSSITFEVLATRGDRLALSRTTWIGTDRERGPSEIEFLRLLEIGGDDELASLITFDPEDLDAAYAELDARHAAGEAAPYARDAEALQRFARAGAARDWDEWATVFAPDFVLEDHRQLGWGTLHSRDEYLGYVRALVDLSPDVTVRFDHVLAVGDRRVLGIVRWAGSREGGPFEIVFASVGELGADGLIQRAHAYDLDQLDEARARFEALGTSTASDPLAALAKANAAAAAMERVYAAIAARDWAATRAAIAADAKIEDRRRHVLVSLDTEGWIADERRIADDVPEGRYGWRLVGTAGDRVELERVLWRGGPPGGLSEIEYLWLTEVDDRGLVTAAVVFDLDDWRAAFADCFARALAVDATAPTLRPSYELAMGLNDHDLAGIRAACADDLVVHDHRLAGLGLVEGVDAYLESLVALWRLVPDDHFEAAFELARERYGVVVGGLSVGTLPEGGAFQRPMVIVSIVAGAASRGWRCSNPRMSTPRSRASPSCAPIRCASRRTPRSGPTIALGSASRDRTGTPCGRCGRRPCTRIAAV
jgi:hypothetical protein